MPRIRKYQPKITPKNSARISEIPDSVLKVFGFIPVKRDWNTFCFESQNNLYCFWWLNKFLFTSFAGFQKSVSCDCYFGVINHSIEVILYWIASFTLLIASPSPTSKISVSNFSFSVASFIYSLKWVTAVLCLCLL